MLRKRSQTEAPKSTLAWKLMSLHTISILTICGHLFAIFLSTKVSLFPGSDVLLSIVSTCAQIIAGLYGITMAGYTFFLSRIDALTASDATLDFIVSSIKRRFKYLIWFITFNVLVTLFISIFLMYLPIPSDSNQSFFYRLFCNEFLFSMAFSVALILYYSILVIDPNCVEKQAAKLKKRLSNPRGPAGDTAEFISLYDQIEAKCNSMLPANVLHQIHENKGKHFEYTIELLFAQKYLASPLIHDLKRIHRYYECTVNCKPLSVTLEMVLLARQLLRFLEQMDKLPQIHK
ncbi:MAG: hypothetical protein IJN67_10140 [Oscillospiraceae bacterium]|nr:hypothetical protein [Oscillospiraceae bacterium]